MTHFLLFIVIGHSTISGGIFRTLEECKTFAVSAHFRDANSSWRKGEAAAVCIEVKRSEFMGPLQQ